MPNRGEFIRMPFHVTRVCEAPGAAKRHGSHRSPAVRLDEYRRAVGQHIGEGEGNVFMQERLIEHRLLNTDVGERPTGRHRHRIDGSAALLRLACRSAGGDGNSADDGCGEGGIFRTGRFRPTNRQQRQQACNPSSPFHSPSSPYYRQAARPGESPFQRFSSRNLDTSVESSPIPAPPCMFTPVCTLTKSI